MPLPKKKKPGTVRVIENLVTGEIKRVVTKKKVTQPKKSTPPKLKGKKPSTRRAKRLRRK